MSITQQMLPLELEWMCSHRVITPNHCQIIHEGSCLRQYFIKLGTVCKLGVKFYLFFHMIPFLLRLRKSKKRQDYKKAVFKLIKDYVKSLLFMGFLVSGTKGALCVNSKLQRHLQGSLFAVSSFVSGASIFWQQTSRQREIGYFVLAKALRSLYVLLKRTHIFQFSHESQIMHILFFAILSYVYHHAPESLKFRDTFAIFWGKD